MADRLILLDIYPASELPIAGVSSQILAEAIAAAGHQAPCIVSTVEQLPAVLQEGLRIKMY